MPPPPKNETTRRRSTSDVVWMSFVSGGIAGCTAKTVVAPLDRVKILFQANSPDYRHLRGSLRGVLVATCSIHSQSGIRGLYQGHSATMMRIFPYAAVKFMAYENYSRLITPLLKDRSPLRDLVAGSLAGITAVAATYPLELVRVKLAFSKNPVPIKTVLASIYNEPQPIPTFGRISCFYRGFMPTLYGVAPYAGISFLVYEYLKRLMSRDGHSSLMTPAFCGAIAGAVSQSVSYPFEIIRRRMQVRNGIIEPIAEVLVGAPAQLATLKAPHPTSKSLGTLGTAMQIYHQGGLRGFFVGLSIGYIKVVPMTMISFWTYEICKDFFGI